MADVAGALGVAVPAPAAAEPAVWLLAAGDDGADEAAADGPAGLEWDGPQALSATVLMTAPSAATSAGARRRARAGDDVLMAAPPAAGRPGPWIGFPTAAKTPMRYFRL